MPWDLCIGAAVLLLVVCSVRERVRQQRYREKDWSTIGEAKSSPLSQAIANLIGVAGGIYLSLMLLCTFIELELPARVRIGSYAIEPLAIISIMLAIGQPFGQRVLQVWRKN